MKDGYYTIFGHLSAHIRERRFFAKCDTRAVDDPLFPLMIIAR